MRHPKTQRRWEVTNDVAPSVYFGIDRKLTGVYTLEFKGGISSSSIRRLKAGESVSTNTLDALCKILDCTLDEIITYLPDKQT